MNVLPNELRQVCQILKEKNVNWDISDDLESIHSNSLNQLITAFTACDNEGKLQRQLAWLAMFAARRALPCWELYCDQDIPHQAVEAVKNWLLTDIYINSWDAFSQTASPSYRGKPIVDCRWCDTVCAAEAAALAVQFIKNKNPLIAMAAISAADAGFDQSPLGRRDNFRDWLIDIAIPAAYELRELSTEEQNLYRSYHALDIPLEREKYGAFWN